MNIRVFHNYQNQMLHVIKRLFLPGPDRLRSVPSTIQLEFCLVTGSHDVVNITDG